MNIIDKTVKIILEKYKEESVKFIDNRDEFLKIFITEYNKIIDTKSSTPNVRSGYVSMIISFPSSKNNDEYIDEKKIVLIRDKITESLLKTMYIKNYISESEYIGLCKKEMLQ